MKILILAHHAAGLYLPRRELLLRLVEQNNEVIVSVPNGEYFSEIKNIVNLVIDTKVDRRGMNPFHDIKLLYTYFMIIRDCKPDCILTYTIKPNLYGGIMAGLFKIPYLMNITGLGSSIRDNGWLKNVLLLLYRYTMGKAHCVFFQNTANRQLFADLNIRCSHSVLIPGSGVNVITNPIEPYPQGGKPLKFLFVARIMREKGIFELAEAARTIKKHYKEIEFHVIGFCEDGYDKQMKKWVNEGVFIYHGEQRNVHHFMKECHALVHPSYYAEGMSNVCLEAAASGRPVLASDRPGCREIVDNGVTGFLFKAPDVNSLIRTIEKFIALPYAKKSMMGHMGHDKVVKQFNREIVIDAYMNEIAKISKCK